MKSSGSTKLTATTSLRRRHGKRNFRNIPISLYPMNSMGEGQSTEQLVPTGAAQSVWTPSRSNDHGQTRVYQPGIGPKQTHLHWCSVLEMRLQVKLVIKLFTVKSFKNYMYTKGNASIFTCCNWALLQLVETQELLHGIQWISSTNYNKVMASEAEKALYIQLVQLPLWSLNSLYCIPAG